jgi:hypothetical protein
LYPVAALRPSGGAGGPCPFTGVVVVVLGVETVESLVVVSDGPTSDIGAVGVVVGVDAVVTGAAVLVATVGTNAAFGVEEAVPQPAAASAAKTNRASRNRRSRTPTTVAQAPADPFTGRRELMYQGAVFEPPGTSVRHRTYPAASIDRQRSSIGW